MDKFVTSIKKKKKKHNRKFGLKLIKFYLRSTMSQERLSGLTILSIKKKCYRNLNTKKT